MPGDSGDKTEKATPKKREDARKKGQVLKSQEVNTAVTMVAMFAAISMFAASILRGVIELLTSYLGSGFELELTMTGVQQMMSHAIGSLFSNMLPMMLVAVVVGVLVNIVQVGFLFTAASIKPKFSKINPMQGFKRIFSMRSVVEMLKAVLKIAVVGFVVYSEYMNNFPQFPNLMGYSVATGGQAVFDMCMSVGFKASIVLIIIGVADFMYQWFDYEKNLRMTKQEIKDEYKMIEGDPKVKGKIKEKQREIAMKRMMADVPDADVVITNPTHYAVALRYDEQKSPSPMVVAKGQDLVAQRIKDRAREAGVEIVENKPVAQALYLTVDIGQSIPEDMFQAVAEILAFVYNKRSDERRPINYTT